MSVNFDKLENQRPMRYISAWNRLKHHVEWQHCAIEEEYERRGIVIDEEILQTIKAMNEVVLKDIIKGSQDACEKYGPTLRS